MNAQIERIKAKVAANGGKLVVPPALQIAPRSRPGPIAAQPRARKVRVDGTPLKATPGEVAAVEDARNARNRVLKAEED